MARMAPYVGYLAIVQMLVVLPIVYVATAGILYLIFNDRVGRHRIVQAALRGCRAYGSDWRPGAALHGADELSRGSMSSKTNLAVFLPAMEGTFVGRLLGTIDLFLIWQFVVLAIGLGVLYRRRTQPIAIGLFVVYGVIALTIAAVMSRFGGSN